MNAFLTGSRVYGTPRTDWDEDEGTPPSDIDLVILCSPEDAKQLWKLAIATARSGEEPHTGQHRTPMFDNLNVIPITDPVKFEAWRKATEHCIAMKPVTRDEAITVFKDEMAKVGVS